MARIDTLLHALDERVIAQRIGIPHDEARMQYPTRANTVSSFREFEQEIRRYYAYHFTRCISSGGSLSEAEAGGRAKELIEHEYRRRNGDIVTAFNDARDGTNAGLRGVLDIICQGIKAESIERYVRDVFDRIVEPNSWEQKVAIIRQFICCCGTSLSSSIRADQPERYARDFQPLIRSYCSALEQTATVFRRF
jgi:hypothetical protein